MPEESSENVSNGIDNIVDQPVDLVVEPKVEKTESLMDMRTQTLKVGYVFARLKNGTGGIVQIPENKFGKIYKEDVWEVVESGKKK